MSSIQLISYFGAWFSQVAIFSLLVSLNASEITIAFVATMSMLPAVVLAPIIGIIIDRVPFKRLMMTLLFVEIAMTLSFILIDSLEYIWVLMILIFIRSSSASILFSAEMTLFPKIVDGIMLKKTNEIHSIIWSLCYASGMAMGGVVTHYMGVDIAFIIDAILYSFAIFILLGLNINLKQIIDDTSNWQMFKDGFFYLLKRKKLIHIILLHASLGFTSFDALVTLLADFEYKEIIAVPLAIGWINATRAFALMIGPFFISNLVNRSTLHYFFILQGLGIILWAFLEYNFYISLIGLFVAGFFTTTLWSYTYLMLQEEVEPKFMGRVISYNDMFFMLSNVIVALFIGYSAKYGVSLQNITVTLGFGFIATSIYYKWFKGAYLT